MNKPSLERRTITFRKQPGRLNTPPPSPMPERPHTPTPLNINLTTHDYYKYTFIGNQWQSLQACSEHLIFLGFFKNNFKACSWGNSLTGGPWPCVCPSFGCSPLCLPSLHILFVPAYFAPLLDYCYSNKTFIFSKHLRAHFEINVVLTISDLIWHLADEQTLTFGERTVFNHTYSN